MNGAQRERAVAWALGIACLVQGALLIYLGGLTGRLALQCVLVAGAIGLTTVFAWKQRMQLNHRIDMAIVMGAFGGLGMIVGWWIDFGCQRAPLWMRVGGVSPGPMSLASSVFSFMTLGMLLAGIPPSLALTRCARLAQENRRRWISTHVIGNLAMVVGMIATNRWIGRTLGRLTGSLVIGAHLAMVLGMVAGMVIGMWLGEAMLGLSPWRDRGRLAGEGM